MEPFITSRKAWEKFRGELSRNTESSRYLSLESAKCMEIGRISVVDNPLPKHGAASNDYVSQAPYWWPDPAKPDGLPYVRRDGETNPEHYQSDRGRLEWLFDSVTCLALKSYSSSSEDEARQAGRLLRCWFLDPDTRMNPHLKYAQFIPGICPGRGIGLIDTHVFCSLIDTICLLPQNEFWTREDLDGFRAWMSEYLDWFLESDLGRQECGEHNNHGTWYDAQAVCFAMFCGREDIARQQIENFTFKRISTQIEPDGRQPHELARTLSMSYCTFNLTGIAMLAQAGSRLGIDIWNWKSDDGRGILPAIRWMLPYYLGEKKWEHRQIEKFSLTAATYLLGLASQGTGDREFSSASEKLSEHPWNRISPWRTGVRKFKFTSN